VVKVIVEESLEYAERYGVRQAPTVLLFRNREEVERVVGAGKKPLYVAKLEALLAEWQAAARTGGEATRPPAFRVRVK
jgi:hypothetical protein